MHTIRIYQPTNAIDISYQFMNFEYAKTHNLDIHDYELIYDCKRESDSLDEIFEEFNMNKPEDFHGHSLSVSDIVLVDNTFYYCDDFGWQDCNEFDWHDELEI